MDTLLAVLAILVPAVLGINELIVRLQERSDIEILIGYFLDRGPTFQVILVKHGKRAITIEDVVLSFKSSDECSYRDGSGRSIHLAPKLPHTLQEDAPPLKLIFPLTFFREENPLDPLDIKRVEVKTLDKNYKFPRRSLQPYYRFNKLKQSISQR